MKKICFILAAIMLATNPSGVHPAFAQAELTPEQLEERAEALEEKADAGDVNAALAYAIYLEEEEEDNRKAAEYYEMAANAGLAEAQHRLGLLYRWGNGVPTNGRKAEAWFLKATAQNYGPAMSSLGEIYADGYVLPLNKEKSVKYYTQAAEFGDPIGQYYIGIKYMYGDSETKKDYRKAAMWLTKSANQNHAPAQASLGILYQYGYGVAQDARKSYDLYIKAAEQGDMNGQYMAGMTLLSQRDPKYYVQGFNYIESAAGKGYEPAMRMMPDLYQQGKGTHKSAKAAYKWHTILYELTPVHEKQKRGQIKAAMKHLGDYISNKERSEAHAAAEKWVREYKEEHGYR